MQGLKLLVLLSSLWGGVFGLSSTQRSWTGPEDEDSALTLNSTSAPLSEVLSLQLLSATQNPSAKAAAAPERPSEDSTLQPSETSTPPEGMGNQTPIALEKTGSKVVSPPFSLQRKPTIKPSSGGGQVMLANATLKFLQSFPQKSSQQGISPKSAADMGSRSPKETHLSRRGSSGNQRTSYRKPSFETTRGK